MLRSSSSTASADHGPVRNVVEVLDTSAGPASGALLVISEPTEMAHKEASTLLIDFECSCWRNTGVLTPGV